MCGCLGVLLVVGSLFYLWDGLWHGFGSTTGFAVLMVLVGIVSIVGYLGGKRKA